MHLSRDVVLLITHSGDFFTIDRVAQAVSKRGAQPFRLDTDKFPLQVKLKQQLGNKSSHRLEYDQASSHLHSIDSNQVVAVWMRRIFAPQMNTEKVWATFWSL